MRACWARHLPELRNISSNIINYSDAQVPDSLMRNILGMSQGPVDDDFNEKENFQTPNRRDILGDRVGSAKNSVPDASEFEKKTTPGTSMRLASKKSINSRTDKDIKYSMRSPDYYVIYVV